MLINHKKYLKLLNELWNEKTSLRDFQAKLLEIKPSEQIEMKFGREEEIEDEEGT